MISVRHLLTSPFVTLVMTYQFSAMHTAAMLDYEYLICYWVNAYMLDETIVVETMGWAFKSSRYLGKSQSYGEFAIYLIMYMTTMLVFDFRWSMGVFHYLI